MNRNTIIKSFIIWWLIFITLSFLIFQKGIWNYLDAFWLNDVNNIINIIKDSINIWSSNTYFGYDNSLNAFFRSFLAWYSYILVHTFWVEWWQVVYYWIYFLLIFIFSSNFFWKIYRDEKNLVFFIGLLATFNPLTIWLMNTSTAIYSLPWFFILINSLYNFFKSKMKFLDILWICIWLWFMMTYGRLLIIFLIITFIYSLLIFLKERKKIQASKSISLWIFIFFIFSPLLYLLWHQKTIDSKYTNTLFNYFQSNANFSNEFQTWLKFNYIWFEKLIFKFHSSNLFQTDNIIINTSFAIIIFTFIFTFFIKVKEKSHFFHQAIMIFFLLFLWIQFIYILPASLFSFIVYKSMFLAWNLYWWKFLTFFMFLFIVAEVLNYYKIKNTKRYFYLLIFFFILLSIFPTTLFIKNFKIQKIDYSNLWEYYWFSMWKNKLTLEWTMFYPENEAIFWNQPYPVKYNYNSNLPVFSDNKRLVNDKQSYLKNVIFDSKYLSSNISLFNTKNIFLFKNLKINNYGVEWYSTDNENVKNEEIYNYLSGMKDFYIKQDNKSFAQFWLKDDYKYEFFLYAPGTIERNYIDTFFSGSVMQMKKKPVNIDPGSFHKPSSIDTFTIPKENQNIIVTYKKSILQPTKIYAEFRNIDYTKAFLIQLNQTFGMSWKVKWITKEQFDEKKCVDEYQKFAITQNAYCNYKAQILDIRDTKYLKGNSVPESQHFEGNFVWNTWLVNPDDISESMRNQNKLYAVIIYEKQIWYNWGLLISGMTFLLLCIITMIQEIRLYSTRKNNA